MSKRVLEKIWILTLLAIVAGCTQSSTPLEDPKKRLTSYINKSFSVRGLTEKEELVGYLSGNAKARLSAWSDEQFLDAFVEAKRKFLKLSVLETHEVSKSEVSLTYELSFLDQTKGRDAKVTNKKVCQMILESGQWFIRDVYNIKELVEFKNELSLP